MIKRKPPPGSSKTKSKGDKENILGKICTTEPSINHTINSRISKGKSKTKKKMMMKKTLL